MHSSSMRALTAFVVVLGLVSTTRAQNIMLYNPIVIQNSSADDFILGPPQTGNLGAFNIVIVPGAGLAGNPAALAAFNRAADQWEALISDPIVVTINADLGALGPGIIGSASSVTLQAGYNTIRNQVVNDAALAPPAANNGIVASLPTAAQFSATMPAGRSLSGNLLGTKANLKALGFAGLDAGFGVSDATITFSNTFSFDYDDSNGVGAGQIDFETVAAHEIGHALGFFSIVDSIDAGATSVSPNTLDLFRFSTGANNPGNLEQFTNNPRNLDPGSESNFDDLTNEYRMSTGVTGGDGRQASHWKDDALLGSHIGIMDPTLANGVAFPVGPADFRALDLIGYDIIVPEPTSLMLLTIAAGCCLPWLRRRNALQGR